MKDVVTRFAPSPTGRLHLGHGLSALLAHRFARTRFSRKQRWLQAGVRSLILIALAAALALLVRGIPRGHRPGTRGQLVLGALGLLAVGSRDANRFFPGMGTLFLRMMGEAFETAMRRFEG